MKVIMFPGRGNRNENRYIDILVSALRRASVEVHDWGKLNPFQHADVFHVHWPELISDIYNRPNQAIRGHLIAKNFFQTIRNVKRGGGKVVWTVHDLQPHKSRLRDLPFHRDLMEMFVPLVDVAISLTDSGINAARAAFPRLRDVPFVVSRHPHYRSIVSRNPDAGRAERARLGIPDDQLLISLVGSLRANKGGLDLAAAFSSAGIDDLHVILAGNAEAEVREKLIGFSKAIPRFHFHGKHLSQSEVEGLYSASDASIYPAKDVFNSGTIYTSLSLDCPVITSDALSSQELADLVGPEWVIVYKGDLNSDNLRRTVDTLRSSARNAACDLSLFAPDVVADQLISAYALV